MGTGSQYAIVCGWVMVSDSVNTVDEQATPSIIRA